jgi:hypothetical protein
MTDKQADKLRLKIKKIKAALAADKKRWGGFYDDSRGLRYLPTEYYIKLGDWADGLKYLKWFHKNFPDDSGFPDFLFEWTIIAFKAGDIKQAEKKVFSVFRSNTYFIDKFFGRPIVPLDKYENSNIDIAAFADNLTYSYDQPNLADFADWLDNFTKTEKFVATSQKFIDIYKRLKTESDTETRHYLIRQARQLEEQF